MTFLTLYVLFTSGPDVLVVISAARRRGAGRGDLRRAERADGAARVRPFARGGRGRWPPARRARACVTRPSPAPDGSARAEAAPVRTPVAQELLGTGTAPSPLAVRLDDPIDVVRTTFRKPPRAGLLFDVGTGQVLWRRNPTRRLPIASLTKMMTALLVTERLPAALEGPDHQAGAALPGLGRRAAAEGQARSACATMLHGLLLPSGNDAARALAIGVAGTIPRFVAEMNAHAAALGLRVHALHVAGRLRGPRQPLLRGGPRRARPRRAARPPAGDDRPPPRRRAAVPDQGRQALPLQQQPAAAPGATRASPASRPATRTRPGCASSPPPAAGRSTSASSCCTRPNWDLQARRLLDAGFRAALAR